MPDVSVLMPVYNVTRYPPEWIRRAVESVSGAELCIGDDGSTDGSAEILQELRPDARIARTNANTGGADACNEAASVATGKYFILLSCRSWYEAGALEAMSHYLDTHPDIGFVYACTRWHGARQGIKRPPAFNAEDWKRYFVSSFGYMYRREAFDNGLRYGCTIYIPEEGRYQTIADRMFAMDLIFRLHWRGFCMQDVIALNYTLGGVAQQNDLFVKYNGRMMDEYHRLLRDVL